MIDWLAYTLVKAIGAFCCALRPEAAVWCGERLGTLAFWLQPKRTRIGVQNLRAAFDGQMTVVEARRIIRASYREMGAALIELLRLPVMDAAYVDRYIAIERRSHFDEAMASGRPVIVLTGHYGNWELTSITAALLGYPSVSLARAQSNLPKLYRLLVSYRESKGCTIVHKGGGIRKLLAALDRRQLVGIVGDQASRQGIFIDFFGRPALFARGPFELAASKQAMIVPFFIHRIGGPYHRIVVERTIELPRGVGRDEAVRQGIAAFAELLTRHIADDPSQWLWMHKRWKYTPARRVLVLSDGKAGHLKQSLAVVEAMRESRPEVAHSLVDVRFRSRLHRGVALLWSWWLPSVGAHACVRWALTPESARALLCRYADLVVSCGASTAAVNLLWARVNQAKSIVLMNPAPLPLRRFDLVIAPRHDQLPRRRNVVQTDGAISKIRDEELLQARVRLTAHPNFRPLGRPERAERAEGRVNGVPPHQLPATPHGDAVLPSTGASRSDVSKSMGSGWGGVPVIGVFLGGDTSDYHLHPAFAQALITAVMECCEALDGWCVVTTSRRTSPSVEQQLDRQLKGFSRCRLLLLASRDAIDGTMEGMLGWSTVALVTGESISMVSEACASGRSVIVVEPPRRQTHAAPTKHRRFLRGLVDGGYVTLAPVDRLGPALTHAIRETRPAKRLDTFSQIREAVKPLL